MIDWPADLPQKLEFEGFQQGFHSGAIRTEMDSGPAFQRQRFSAAVQTIAGSITIDAAQYARFIAFYRQLGQGALAFIWAHPLTGDAAPMRFDVTQPPQIAARTPTLFRVSMTLEILP